MISKWKLALIQECKAGSHDLNANYVGLNIALFSIIRY